MSTSRSKESRKRSGRSGSSDCIVLEAFFRSLADNVFLTDRSGACHLVWCNSLYINAGLESNRDCAMRRLMLLRHAKTENDAPTGRDQDRRLDNRGRQDAAEIGGWIGRHPPFPELVLVSHA